MRNIYLILSIVFVFVIKSTFAQNPSIVWQKTFGGNGNDIMQDIYPTADGNYILLGLTDKSDGDVDCNHKEKHDTWVIKMDPTGNIIWQACYGGFKEEGNPNSKIVQTSDGGYLFTTETWSDDGDVIGHHNKSDAWTVKLDATGGLTWARSYGGENWDVPRNLLELPGKRYVVISRSTSADGDVPPNIDLDPESFDAWVFIVDSTGNIISNHVYGGTGDDELYRAFRLPDHNLVLFGMTSSTDGDLAGLPVDSTDAWVLVIDTVGNIISNKVYGNAHYESFLDALQTSDGGFIAFGEITDPAMTVEHGYWHGEVDYWAAKLDASYNIQWQGIYGGSDQEQFRRAAAIPGGGYYLAGTSTSLDGDVTNEPNQARDWWIIKLGDDGTLLGSTILGGSNVDYPYAIVGSGIGVGGTFSNDGDVIDLDGTADGWVLQVSIPVGVSTPGAPENIKIYPNPAADILTIEAQGFHDRHVQIVNYLGQVALNTKAENSVLNLDVSHYAPGIYLAIITDENSGKVFSQHFEVVH